jgi:hypothetical protein
MVAARLSSAALVLGKYFLSASRNVETLQKNIPAFQRWLPEARYFSASAKYGFSFECFDRKNGERRSGNGLLGAVNVAESGLRARGWKGQPHHAAGFASHVQSQARDLSIFLGLRNLQIGGQYGHQRVPACSAANVIGGQRDGCRGTAALGQFGRVNVLALLFHSRGSFYFTRFGSHRLRVAELLTWV